jgi:hypothetical protein
MRLKGFQIDTAVQDLPRFALAISVTKVGDSGVAGGKPMRCMTGNPSFHRRDIDATSEVRPR